MVNKNKFGFNENFRRAVNVCIGSTQCLVLQLQQKGIAVAIHCSPQSRSIVDTEALAAIVQGELDKLEKKIEEDEQQRIAEGRSPTQSESSLVFCTVYCAKTFKYTVYATAIRGIVYITVEITFDHQTHHFNSMKIKTK